MKKTILTLIGGLFFYFQVSAQPSFFITDAIPNAGVNFTLDVGVKDFTDLLSTEYTVRWDPSVISFVAVNNLNLVDLEASDFDFTNAVNGYLTLQWAVGNNPDACSDPFADGVTIPDSTIIYELEFIAIGSICDQTNVFIDNDPLPIYITRKFVPNPNCLNISALVDEVGLVSIFTCDWEITQVVTPPSCDNTNDGEIVLDISGGFGTYSYDWSDDIYDGLSVLENLASGIYEVTITDEACCESILNFDLTVEDNIAPVFQTCPPDTCLVLPVGATVGIYSWDLPIAEDNCSTADALTYFSNGYPLGEGIFNLGETTVEYTASDEKGNLSEACQFIVDVKPSSDLTFYPDTTKVTVNGNCINVPVKFLNFTDVTSFQYSIRVTPQLAIDSIVVIQNPDNPDPVEWEMIDNHVITVNWTSSIPEGRTVPDSTTIFGLQIKLLEDNDDCKIIRFTNEPIQKWATFANNFQAVPTTINRGLCVGPSVSIGGAILSLNQEPLKDIEVNCTGTPADYTNEQGIYRFDNLAWQGNYVIAPFYDQDPLNGVNVADLVLIRDHLLQQSQLPDGYARIAADVNNSGDMSIIDLVLIGQLILGFADALPADSWQFVPQAFPINVPAANTGVPVFPQTVPLPNVLNNRPNIDFWGIKMGDVNNSADTDWLVEDSNTLWLKDQTFKKGDLFEIRLTPNMEAMQGRFNILPKQLRVIDVVSKDKETLPKYHLNRSANSMAFLWLKDIHDDALVIQVEAMADGKLSEALMLESAMGVNEERALERLKLAFISDIIAEKIEHESVSNISWQPNPFSSEARLNIALDVDQELQLSIFDARGALLFQAQEYFPKGQSEWIVNPEIFDAKGVYFYQIRFANQEFVSGKMIRN